jgi:hypothetical protein
LRITEAMEMMRLELTAIFVFVCALPAFSFCDGPCGKEKRSPAMRSAGIMEPAALKEGAGPMGRAIEMEPAAGEMEHAARLGNAVKRQYVT